MRGAMLASGAAPRASVGAPAAAGLLGLVATVPGAPAQTTVASVRHGPRRRT